MMYFKGSFHYKKGRNRRPESGRGEKVVELILTFSCRTNTTWFNNEGSEARQQSISAALMKEIHRHRPVSNLGETSQESEISGISG